MTDIDDIVRRAQEAKRPSAKIEAHSYERYNGGVRMKRLHGSSTVTRFYVFFTSDRADPNKWMSIDAYGKTPGDRKTYAINEFKKSKGL